MREPERGCAALSHVTGVRRGPLRGPGRIVAVTGGSDEASQPPAMFGNRFAIVEGR